MGPWNSVGPFKPKMLIHAAYISYLLLRIVFLLFFLTNLNEINDDSKLKEIKSS